MKAILVIELDDELGKKMHSCDFMVIDRYGSHNIYPTINFKPMPKEYETHNYELTSLLDEGYLVSKDILIEIKKRGYNQCLKELVGEEE